MTIQASQLVAPIQLAASVTVYYQGPTNTTTRIDRATFANPTAGAITITVYIVASGGTPSAANVLIPLQSIGANATYQSPELAGQVLPPGATLQALSSSAGSIVMSVSGLKVS